MVQQILRDDGAGYKQKGICGGNANGDGTDKETDHQNDGHGWVDVLDNILNQVGDDVLRFIGAEAGQQGDADQSDQHGAGPDKGLQDRCQEHQFALCVQV